MSCEPLFRFLIILHTNNYFYKPNLIKQMKKILFSIVLLAVTWTAAMAMAVPAMPGMRMVKQSDGTVLTFQDVGDEWTDLLLTSDGLTINRGDDGDFYYITTSGLSSVRAHNVVDRKSEELSFINANRNLMTIDALLEADKESGKLRGKHTNGINIKRVSVNSQKTTVHIPVFLVGFSNRTFSHTETDYNTILMTQAKSVAKYFNDQSNGQFNPIFDVYGVYKLDNTYSYYGNNNGGKDHNRTQFVLDALSKVRQDSRFSTINWKQFDSFDDNDNIIDVCIFIYAGTSESQTSVPEELWPCRSNLDKEIFDNNTTLNGVKVNDYIILNEISNTGGLDGIGTFCHEFSHCLGLPDFYKIGGKANTGMGYWSIMAHGCYNDNSNTPIGYSAYEKNFMGWLTFSTPEENKDNILFPLNHNNSNENAFKISGFDDRECWILEYRQKNGSIWDAKITDHIDPGLLITHYTYVKDYWDNNLVNNQTNASEYYPWLSNRDLQMAEVVNDGKGSTSFSNFIANIDANGNLGFHDGDGGSVNKSVSDISYSNSSYISFRFTGKEEGGNGGGTTPTIIPLDPPTLNDASNVQATSFVASWDHTPRSACTYTLKVVDRYNDPVLLQENISGTSFTVEGLQNNSLYYYKVKAIASDSQGIDSEWSDEKKVRTLESQSTTPIITASTTNVNFTGYTGGTYTKTVNVTGANLTAAIAANLTSGDNNIYNIAITQKTNGAELTITWKPTTAGQTAATVVLSSAGAQNVTINITGNAQNAPVPTITASTTSVNFTGNTGETYTKTVNVTGANLTEAIAANLTSGDNNIYNIAITQKTNGAELTITWKPTTAGQTAATVVLSSAGAQDVTINITGVAQENGGSTGGDTPTPTGDGTASDLYLNIANYSTITTAGAVVDGMESIYKYTPYPDDNIAWLTVSNYGAMKADATQNWITSEITTPGNGSWNANDVFLGNGGYFGNSTGHFASWANQVASQYFYVTNCSQVKQYVKNLNNRLFPLPINIYECTLNPDGTLTEITPAADAIVSTVSGEEILTSSELNPNKIYKVEIINDYSYLYEIAFRTELTEPQVNTPVLTVDNEPISFETFVGEEVSKTVTVAGEFISNDVTITSNNENFTVSPATIAASDLANGNSVNVTVTFAPQAQGNFTGSLTIASEGAESKTIALNGEANVHTPVLTINNETIAFDVYVGETVSKTFAVAGEYISNDVTITSDNENFTVNPATIAANDLANGNTVNVTVTFAPQAQGNFTGNLTIATEGAESKTVALNGEANVHVYDNVAPTATSASKIGFRNFTANWNACTGATSYTLRVVPKAAPVLPPVTPPATASLIMTETFANCTRTVSDFSTLDNYTDNGGWDYIRVYIENGGLRIGSKYAGTLTSPALDLSESNGKVSVKVKARAYDSDTNCSLTIGCGNSTQTVDVPDNNEVEYTTVLDCTAAQGQNITFKNNGTNKRVILTYVEVYSGDVTATAASAPALNATPADTIIITGITSNSYKVTGLKTKTTYIYDVKAVYSNGVSPWSNQIEVTTFNSSYYIDDLIKHGSIGDKLVINDDLVVVHVNGSTGKMWCKDQGHGSVNSTEKKDGQIDFMREITGLQIGEWDQSNWIMLKFPEDDGNNGIKAMLENAVGKTIVGGTISGCYTDDVNYTLEVIPEDGTYTLELGDDVDYVKNMYCTANFLLSNLNVNGGDGACGRIDGNEVYYFFMNPKVQEVCEITSAQFDEDGMFVNPDNNSQIRGAVKVDWSYNAEGIQWPEKGKVYRFMAVVNRVLDNENDSYIVYPLNFSANGSSITAIGTIDGCREVIGVNYVNVSGLVSDKPFKGVNIVVTHYSDGSSTTTKKLYK